MKDRRSPYRDGSRAGWFKVKDRSWYEREAWRFQGYWNIRSIVERSPPAETVTLFAVEVDRREQ